MVVYRTQQDAACDVAHSLRPLASGPMQPGRRQTLSHRNRRRGVTLAPAAMYPNPEPDLVPGPATEIDRPGQPPVELRNDGSS